MGEYDIGQICLNGHVTNPYARDYPQHNQKYCNTCGAETITNCRKCNAPIRGRYHSYPSPREEYTAPSFCINCGETFPWALLKIEAANTLAKELGIEKEDREILEKSIDDLAKDTPLTQVAANRFKRIMDKIPPDAKALFYGILANVFSTPITKYIWS